MRKIRDVLRYRHSTELSLEAIARVLNISKGVVAKYLKLAADAGLGWPLPADLDDGALEQRLYSQASAQTSVFTEPDYALVHQELKRKGVTHTERHAFEKTGRATLLIQDMKEHPKDIQGANAVGVDK